MEVDYGAHSPADRIEDALDYDFVRRGIHDFAGRHFALQETLCEAIAALCLRDPRVRSVRVRSMKPDIYPDRSEEHTSELQSLMRISYAVFCLKKNTINMYKITSTL